MGNFLQEVLNYEQQGINRQALMSLVKPQIEAIDEKRKAIRESIESDIKSLGAIEACKACNALCPTESGADNAARQRLSRRRNWLKSLLAKVHTEYNFVLTDGVIFAEYIGDAHVREAKSIFASLTKLVDLDVIDSLPCEFNDILAGLKSASNEGIAKGESLKIDDATVLAIHDIGANIADLMTKFNGTSKTAKEAQEVKEVKEA